MNVLSAIFLTERLAWTFLKGFGASKLVKCKTLKRVLALGLSQLEQTDEAIYKLGLWVSGVADETMFLTSAQMNWFGLTAGLCCAKGDCCNEPMALQGGARIKLVYWQQFMGPEQLLAGKKILNKQ